MSFKGAIRTYLLTNSGVMDEFYGGGSLLTGLTADDTITSFVLSNQTTEPPATGTVIVKNAAGNYEFIDYTAVVVFGGTSYTFTCNHTLTYSYAIFSDFGAVVTGIYSFPAPQEASLPYILLQRIATTEIYNRLNSQGTTIVEQWQTSCYAATDEACEDIKIAVISALNAVNPDTWSDDGGATFYSVHTSVFESETTIPELKDDGSQSQITHKPITFTVIRSIASS